MIASTITVVVLTLSTFTPLAGGKWDTKYTEHGPYMTMKECMDALDAKFDSGIQGVGSCKWRVLRRQK